jgi:hypothetical protein
MKIRYVVILIGLSLALASCSQNQFNFRTECSPYPRPNLHPVPIGEESWLVQATQSGRDSLESFFASWHERSLPYGGVPFDSLNDTLKAAYELFRQFYELDSSYLSNRYIVLQSTVSLGIFDSASLDLVSEGREGSIFGSDHRFCTVAFQPKINVDGEVLYLTEPYWRALNYFFNGEDASTPYLFHPIGGREWHDLRVKEDWMRRYIPLDDAEYRSIGFQYYSFPYVRQIAFSTDLKRVRFEYFGANGSGAIGGLEERELKGTEWVRSKSLGYYIDLDLPNDPRIDNR